MNKLRILIVDDEWNARAALKGMISSNFDDIEIVDEAASLPEAVKLIHKHKPDAVLLDIEMPGYLGTDIIDFFDTDLLQFHIIFVTAYNEYTLKAFDAAAIDYLLKPTRIEHLHRAFNRVRHYQPQLKEKFEVLKENTDIKKPEKIILHTSEGFVVCKLNDILYCKADSAYTHIKMRDNKRITISKSLQEFEHLEETGVFLRINRSYIINLNAIEKIVKKEGGFIVMEDGEEVSAGPEKRQKLIEKFSGKIF
jgi:two-component system LytT family response regulator